MVKIIWTLQAVKDLDNIAEFIAKDSVKYARLTVQNIRIKTRILKENAFLGRVVPESGIKEIRELIFGNYRIIYQVNSKDLVSILTIHHSARQLSYIDLPR